MYHKVLVVPDTDLAGYRISGEIVNKEICFFLNRNFQFSTKPTNISGRYFTLILSEKSLLIRSSHHLFNSLTGYTANETGYPVGYRISKKAVYPVKP